MDNTRAPHTLYGRAAIKYRPRSAAEWQVVQPIDLTNPNRFHVRFALDGDVWLTQQKRIPNTPDWGIARWSLRLERQQIERSTAFEEFRQWSTSLLHCHISKRAAFFYRRYIHNLELDQDR